MQTFTREQVKTMLYSLNEFAYKISRDDLKYDGREDIEGSLDIWADHTNTEEGPLSGINLLCIVYDDDV